MKTRIHRLYWHSRMYFLLLLLYSAYLPSAYAQCCPPDLEALPITKTAYLIEQTINEDDPLLASAISPCLPYTDTLPSPDSIRYRHIIPLYVSAEDVIIIHTPADSTVGINEELFLAIYQGSFDLNAPCNKLVSVSNLAPAEGADIRLATQLKAETPYYLLVTTTTPMATGDYQLRITTAKDSTSVFMVNTTVVTNPDWTIDTLTEVVDFPTQPHTFSLPLNCRDDGLISSTELELTGDPNQQPGCSTIENLTYQEEIDQLGDCGATLIKRTFTFDGPNGATASCVQRITLRLPSSTLQQGIWLPPANITVGCGYPCMFTGNAYPGPEETGAPFVLTVSGPKSLYEQDLCNLGTAYEDSAPVEACETHYTFIRNWTIIDWCHPQEFYLFDQHIQVGEGPCAATVSSSIYTEDGEGVVNVQVVLTTDSSTDTVYTSSTGSYDLPADFVIDSSFGVEPLKDYDYHNGVSTFDMVLISKHILGVTPLSSPYKMIAADVNNSGSITTLDLIQIRKLVLGIISEFPNNTSWRFVNPSFVFSDPSNPWSGVDTTDIPQALWPRNFIGVKVGDINNSADPTSLQANLEEVSTREGSPFYLHTANRLLQAHQTYNIPVFARELLAIDGFQATLQASPDVELLNITGGLMSDDHFGPIQPNGTVAMSWLAPQEPVGENQLLFTLEVKTKASIPLKESLLINESLIPPEAYGKDGYRYPVAFQFTPSTTLPEVPQLGANYPNPFRETTQIDFYLPEERLARLTVHNATGQLLCTVEVEGTSGWNTILLSQVLSKVAAGVLYYTLTVDDHRLTKRMVKLQ